MFTCKAEYIAASTSLQDVLWIQRLFHVMASTVKPTGTPFILNNTNALQVANNGASAKCRIHIDSKHHRIDHLVNHKQVHRLDSHSNTKQPSRLHVEIQPFTRHSPTNIHHISSRTDVLKPEAPQNVTAPNNTKWFEPLHNGTAQIITASNLYTLTSFPL